MCVCVCQWEKGILSFLLSITCTCSIKVTLCFHDLSLYILCKLIDHPQSILMHNYYLQYELSIVRTNSCFVSVWHKVGSIFIPMAAYGDVKRIPFIKGIKYDKWREMVPLKLYFAQTSNIICCAHFIQTQNCSICIFPKA